MPSWKKYKLGELVSHKKGFPFKSKDYLTKGIPIIRVSDLTEDSIDLSNCLYINTELRQLYSDYTLAKDDMVITTVGSWQYNPASVVGKVIKVPAFANNSLLNQNAVRLRTNEKAFQLFIFYRLKCEDFKDYIVTGAQGSANQAAITLEQIFGFEFNLPDLATQTRIASILSALDDKIELNRRTNHTLEQMAQTLFKKYFVTDIDPDKLPEGWRWAKMGDYIDTISKTHKFPKEQIIFLNTSDILEGKVLINTYSQVESLPGQAKKSIQKNDILFSEIRPGNKRYAYINFDAEDYVVSTKLMVLRSKQSINSLFFYFILTREDMLSHLQNLAEARSGTFPQITFDQIRELDFLLPDEATLKSFIEKTLKPTYELIFKKEKEIETLSKLRDSLLPKLMSGEITVN